MKVEVAAREIGVRGYSNLVEGMTPAGRWLKRDMIFYYIFPACFARTIFNYF
jgi:hypothetical protein